MVWLTPILPFINDTEENIRAILDACAQVKVKGIICFDMGLTLREGDREYFYAHLDRKFPGLKAEYIRRYGNAYEVMSPDGEYLDRLFHELCETYGIWHDNDRIFTWLQTLEEPEPQLSFF